MHHLIPHVEVTVDGVEFDHGELARGSVEVVLRASKLSNDFGKLQGEFSVDFDGKKMTREELARLQEDGK